MATITLDIDNDLDAKEVIKFISMLKGINKVSINDNWDNWSDLEETNYLRSIPGFMEALDEEDKVPLEECSDVLEWD